MVVLEARERSGGRVLTVRSPFDDGLSGEAGPIRIAGAHRAVLRAVREHGLTLVPFESSNGAPLDPPTRGRHDGAQRRRDLACGPTSAA